MKTVVEHIIDHVYAKHEEIFGKAMTPEDIELAVYEDERQKVLCEIMKFLKELENRTLSVRNEDGNNPKDFK
jgi:hypothetical protein